MKFFKIILIATVCILILTLCSCVSDDASNGNNTDTNASNGNNTDTNASTQHKHGYKETVVHPTCTEQGYTLHSCLCGDSYTDTYTTSTHQYVNYVCKICGNINENYALYKKELEQLTLDYNSDIAELEDKISNCEKNIANAQKNTNEAYSQLSGLSPSCPSWYIQQFVSTHLREYGNSYTATQAAVQKWSQEYTTQKTQLESTISRNNSIIQNNQNNISIYNSAISNRIQKYNMDIDTLKTKYGIS